MLTIGIDWDDVICDLNARAIELANKDYDFKPKLSLSEIKNWEITGRASVIKEYYKTQELYDSQFVTEEAKAFVNTLRTKGDVYICTAIAPEFMSTRAAQIKAAFPDFPSENIIMGFQKSLVHFDVTLDDGAHNILKSNSRFPVLFRKPWNHEITGILSVNNYEDFLQMLEQIKKTMIEDRTIPDAPAIIALVGPSGSGKDDIANILIQNKKFAKPTSYSTKPSNKHQYIPKHLFYTEDFLETTMYAGNGYGTKKDDIEGGLKQGKYLVIPLDICGAVAMKRYYPTLIVFCKCKKEKCIEHILEKNISNHEKKLRLLSLDKEMQNERLCDYVIRTDDPLSVEKFMNAFS